MGLYFAESSGVTWGNLAWFLFAAATGVASLWLWQFVLLPYDPRRSLRDSVRAFYRRAASIVDAISTGLEEHRRRADEAAWEKNLARPCEQVKLSRRAIESQFPGVLAPGGWTEAQISQLQLALYTTEQGLAQMVEGAERSRRTSPASPTRFGRRSARSLRSLQEALSPAARKACRRWPAKTPRCKTEVRAYAAPRGDSDAGHADSRCTAALRGWLPRCA